MIRSAAGKMQNNVTRKLAEGLRPTHLVVTNESYKHSVPKDAETHFHVLIVSNDFAGKNMLQRHRTINGLLREELSGGKENGIHALSINAKTSDEWEANSANRDGEGKYTTGTPNCMGGDAKPTDSSR